MNVIIIIAVLFIGRERLYGDNWCSVQERHRQRKVHNYFTIKGVNINAAGSNRNNNNDKDDDDHNLAPHP